MSPFSREKVYGGEQTGKEGGLARDNMLEATVQPLRRQGCPFPQLHDKGPVERQWGFWGRRGQYLSLLWGMVCRLHAYWL